MIFLSIGSIATVPMSNGSAGVLKVFPESKDFENPLSFPKYKTPLLSTLIQHISFATISCCSQVFPLSIELKNSPSSVPK